MKMSDGQHGPQLRSMTCELGQLSRPDGSVSLFQGDTCVMMSVYGPGEVKINKEQIDQATVEVIYKPKTGLPGCFEKSMEIFLSNTCEAVLLTSLHPRSSISLTSQEVQNSGSLLAVCVNACCLALLDASVNMKTTMAAVSCCIDAEGVIKLDPTRQEEESCRAKLTFVFEGVNQDIVTTNAEGKFSTDEFQTSLVLCREASSSVFNFYRETLERKLSKTV